MRNFYVFRTKIQAQRKYAQGQQGPTSAYLNYNSGQSTPVKENSNPPVDFLPNNKKPKSEDFMTYLCFKGTDMLPKNLDFSNMSGTSAMNSSGPSTSKSVNSNISNSTASKTKNNHVEKEKEIMPFAVRKRADAQPEKPDKKKFANNRRNLKNNNSESEKSQEDTTPNSRKTKRGRNAVELNVVTEDVLPTKSQKIESNNVKNPEKIEEKEKAKPVKQDNTKRTTRLGALRNSYYSSSTPTKEVEQKVTEEKDFSSDDDEPLIKSTETPRENNNTPASNKKQKIPETKVTAMKAKEKLNESDGELKKSKAKRIDEERKDETKESVSLNQTNDSEDKTPTKQGTAKKRGRPALNKNQVKTSTPIEKPEEKAITPSPVESPEEKSIQKKKVGRKKKLGADAEIAELSQANTTDLSENEAIRGANRPQRKSKAAAELYLHLIGRKLAVNDFSDDDGSSLDSLELPNFKKIEQMENELKANVNKKAEEKLVKEADEKLVKVEEIKPEKNNEEKPSKSTQNKGKSFNESDEEPLVTKVSETKKPAPKKRGRKSAIEKQQMLLEQQQQSEQSKEKEKQDKKVTDSKINVSKTPEKIVAEVTIKSSKKDKNEVPITFQTNQDKSKSTEIEKLSSLEKKSFLSPSSKLQSSQNMTIDTFNISNQFSTSKQNQSATENNNYSGMSATTPAATPLSPQAAESSQVSFQKVNFKTSKPETSNFNKLLNEAEDFTAKPISLVSKSSINLLPSKEESEKIFGIASVTLAQSSGPLDTKCTLGKCGSIHKPSLGPAVLTESALGVNLSPKDRRKTKVNMTREQIQKWLDQTSWTPIPDELEDDLVATPTMDLNKSTGSTSAASRTINKTPPVQSSFVPSKNDDSNKEFTRSSDIVSTPTTSKGPTLKAKAVSVVPEVNNKEKNNQKTPELVTSFSKFDFLKNDIVGKKKEGSPKIMETPKKTVQTPEPKKQPVYQPEKKPIYQKQKKTPVYKQEQVKPKTQPKQQFPVSNAFGAFQAENEYSVYSFDREEDEIPAGTPFRRTSSKPELNTSKEKEDTSPKKDFQKPQSLLSGNTTPNKQIQIPQVSLTLSPEDNKKSATIPVNAQTSTATSAITEAVTKDKSGEIPIEVKLQENDSDSEGHTFYIPLQTTTVAGNKNDQLIQGVAVKLGTEGAEGPNQKIIMHAKLVTKSRIGSSAPTLPESMTNVQELVKSLMAGNKEVASSTTTSNLPTTKPVPCATVQPRFKSTSGSQENLSQQNDSLPSTSKSAVKPIPTPPVTKPKVKYEGEIQPTNNTVFPNRDDPGTMVDAPIFRPTEKEFQDPLEYIEKITPIASRFGICRIIPPDSFKPECRVSDEMRFTAYNQYVHKMLHRWGPSAKEFAAIKKYLATQSIFFQHPPLIAGMEVDLPRLYHTVQELGGLREVIEKKKWSKVAEDMCIPKSAHDRATKLDDIYCKYLLPYDTLSLAERQKLFDEVEADWAKRETKARRSADKGVESDEQSNEEDDSEESDEDDNDSMECMVKGRSMSLSQFFRVARNTMALIFKNTAEPTTNEIEVEYWHHVAVRSSHVCVHYGSIDSSGYGYGFPAPGPKQKSSVCSKHPWNLKVLTNNSKSILRSLGPVMGITVPTLHVGMLFSAVCWYRDPHGLPWIEYLHTGASKIWYGVPDEQSAHLRSAMTSLVPSLVQNKTIWLPCDTAMVPPYMLTDRNVSLCRTEQHPGQFVVVFPRAYTSSLCTGYTVSESVYFADSSWLDTATEDFKVRENRFKNPTVYNFF